MNHVQRSRCFVASEPRGRLWGLKRTNLISRSLTVPKYNKVVGKKLEVLVTYRLPALSFRSTTGPTNIIRRFCLCERSWLWSPRKRLFPGPQQRKKKERSPLQKKLIVYCPFRGIRYNMVGLFGSTTRRLEGLTSQSGESRYVLYIPSRLLRNFGGERSITNNASLTLRDF